MALNVSVSHAQDSTKRENKRGKQREEKKKTCTATDSTAIDSLNVYTTLSIPWTLHVSAPAVPLAGWPVAGEEKKERTGAQVQR